LLGLAACGEPKIEALCSVTGVGGGVCRFVNTGSGTGSMCAGVRVCKRTTNDCVGPVQACSGDVRAHDTREMGLTIAGIYDLCAWTGALWTDVCEVRVDEVAGGREGFGMSALLLLISALVVLGTSIWAAVDAASVRERIAAEIEFERPSVVLLGCLLFWIVCFPIYLVRRSRALAADAEWKAGRGPGRNPSRADRIAEREREERNAREEEAPRSPSLQTPATRIKALDELRGNGLITAEEYDQKRAEILSQV